MNNDQLMLGLLILVVGFAVVLPLIYWYGTRRGQAQDQRRHRPAQPGRIEPSMSREESREAPNAFDAGDGLELDWNSALDSDNLVLPEQGELLDQGAAVAADAAVTDDAIAGARTAAVEADLPAPPKSDVGARPGSSFDRIVSLFVRARGGHLFRGDELVVVAEKVGLVYGHMGIYHRLVEGREKEGPVFSVANIAKPGSFDLRRMDELETPGLSFFMTLPGPLPALDAWNTMLPVAQRIAQLLEADLLDESRNPLVEQTIGFIRNEMRTYDREQEKQNIRTRW